MFILYSYFCCLNFLSQFWTVFWDILQRYFKSASLGLEYLHFLSNVENYNKKILLLLHDWNVITRYRAIFLKMSTQGIVFYCILKSQEFKIRVFFEGLRRYRGPQKSEKFNFSKRKNDSVDHNFKSHAIN